MYSDGSSHESCGAALSGTSGAAEDEDDAADGVFAGCDIMYEDDDERAALEFVCFIILLQVSEIVMKEYIFGSKKLFCSLF